MAASSKGSTGTFLAFVACAVFGVLMGLLFNPLAAQLRQALSRLTELRADIVLLLNSLQPMLSEAAIGLVLFGMGAYIISRLLLRSFSRRVLNGLAAALKAKNLLPYTFEATK